MQIDRHTMARVERIRRAIRTAQFEIWNYQHKVFNYKKQNNKDINREIHCGSETKAELMVKQLRIQYAAWILGLNKAEVEHYIFEVFYEPPEKWENWLLHMLYETDAFADWKKAVTFIQYNRGK